MSEFVVKKQNYRCELIRCCGWSKSDRDEEMASDMMRGRGRRTLKCGNDPDDLLRLVFFTQWNLYSILFLCFFYGNATAALIHLDGVLLQEEVIQVASNSLHLNTCDNNSLHLLPFSNLFAATKEEFRGRFRKLNLIQMPNQFSISMAKRRLLLLRGDQRKYSRIHSFS